MVKKGLRKEEVFEAIESLLASGKEPTINAIRDVLKRGSLTTITKYTKEWKEKNKPEGKALASNQDSTEILDNLDNIDLELLFNYFKEEHPQIVAVIITYLAPENSAKFLKKLKKDHRAEVLSRVAGLNPVQPNMLGLLNRVLEKEITSVQPYQGTSKGGVAYVNSVLDCLDPNTKHDLETDLKKSVPDLKKKV